MSKTDFSDFAGRWVTVNGRRIFIKDGETPNEAFDRTFFGKKKPKSSEPKKKEKVEYILPKKKVKKPTQSDSNGKVVYVTDDSHKWDRYR